MSNIIPLSTLADLLARHADIPTDRATEFIRAYFDTIEQSLTTDRTLSVPGLGIFEIVSDESVSFTPAPEFASRVNEAYEIFPAIELDSDIDIESFEISETQEPVEHQPEVLPEPEIVPEPEPAEEIVVEEPVGRVEDEPQPQPQPQPEPEPVPEATPEPEPKEEIEEQISPVEQPVYEDSVEYENEEKRCCTALYIILTALIALIIGIILGYLGRHRIEAFVNSSGEPEVTTETSDSLIADEENTVSNIETIEIDTSTVNLTEADIAEINDPETDMETDDPTSEPTVRYDTVTGKRFLTTMAREYFGHQDYWSYIYLANKTILKHPDRIRPGSRVVIPDFETYKTSDDPEQNRNDARRKGIEIYNNFK